MAYAAAHGCSPEVMAMVDREKWPGGRMAGFQIWIHQRWAEWYAENGLAADAVLSDEDHTSFTAWLYRLTRA